jgi:predicted ribosomally synthesized peptide with nif11-like leader
MSIEQARLFIERIKSDAVFRERVTEMDQPPARLAYIQSEGFQCSEKEINEVACELSDEDLDTATGGWSFLTLNTTF